MTLSVENLCCNSALATPRPTYSSLAETPTITSLPSNKHILVLLYVVESKDLLL